MRVVWSDRALSDLDRVYEFLAPKSRRVAVESMRTLRRRVLTLEQAPRLGERLDFSGPAEIRRLFIGKYELRYQIDGEIINVLRVWHTRENR